VAEIRARMAIDKEGRNRHLLVCINGPFVGQVFPLDGETCTIGRAPKSDIWVHEDGISRNHARIESSPDGFWLEDCGSSNGTFVDGALITGKHLLTDAEVIQVGASIWFRYSHTDREHEQMLQSLYEASVRDPLTGAFNREYFDERMRAEVSFSKRHKSPLALVMFDLDKFKSINDTYGHPAGDLVLTTIVDKVTAAIRLEDVLARYGGEEFALVLRSIPLDGAFILAERIRRMMADLRIEVEGGIIRPTASFGIATLACLQSQSVEHLIDRADKRLLSAKRTGRNKVVIKDL
jgi:diguanylate cyclase (GGDEF)-like protein